MSQEAPSKSNHSGLKSFLSKYNFKVGEASDEYIDRRKKQMMLFMGSAAVTIFASRFAHKSTISRQYIPTLFQGNHAPPLSYNFATDAAVAVGTGTILCGSVSSMVIFGSCWILDVSTFKEFGWKMKALMGGYDKERELSQIPMDEESALIQDSLNDILEGKYDFDDIEEAKKQ
ncbi:altered inheritance of mitochondria protein 11 [Scheffersomyces xylosifermentans]|uniref:altered inheritance of mitochondria protein 11 n=1 Tax=Scheffersomyces xylosifermentans TaxID=1304137 RepID=UPI00315CD46E